MVNYNLLIKLLSNIALKIEELNFKSLESSTNLHHNTFKVVQIKKLVKLTLISCNIKNETLKKYKDVFQQLKNLEIRVE